MAVFGRACLLAALILCLHCMPATAASPSAGEKALIAAILAANNTVQTVTLTKDVTLTAKLPSLQYNATLHVQGACKGRRCVVSGAGRYSGFSCVAGGAIVLQDLELTRFRGGAITGGCLGVGVPYGLVARRVSFLRNYNPVSGGAIYVDFVGAQITSCLFEYNNARVSGGAIRADAGFSLNIYNSTFAHNGALTRDGGAVSGVVSSIKASTFRGNAAATNGGAVSTLTTSAFYITKSTFEDNRAKGLGGAVYLVPAGTPYWLCNTSFRGNRAVASRRSNDLYAVAASPNGIFSGPSTIRLCGGATPVWTLNNNTAVKTCLGCTGCSARDCYGRGVCVYDPVDANPSCHCKPNYTPASDCVACLPGYAVTAKCLKCAPGYNAVAGSNPVSCAPCSAIAASGILPDPASSLFPLIGGGPAASYQSCAALCAASQNTVSPVTGYVTSCQLWAYFDGSAPAGCKDTCILWNETGACSNSTVIHKPEFGLYTAQFDNGSCGP